MEAINDDRLYRALDKVGVHKDRLCQHLMERYRQWFGVRFEFLLYDVTSTYFEGLAEKNTKAARGYSRDQRSDCKQVCIGLVCTPEGLPLNFEVFAGNRADVTERIWVMDRDMVSEASIELLRQRKALYIVGTPKSQIRVSEAELTEKENWIEVEKGVEARLVDHPDGKGQERYVLCRSSARGAKNAPCLSGKWTTHRGDDQNRQFFALPRSERSREDWTAYRPMAGQIPCCSPALGNRVDQRQRGLRSCAAPRTSESFSIPLTLRQLRHQRDLFIFPCRFRGLRKSEQGSLC